MTLACLALIARAQLPSPRSDALPVPGQRFVTDSVESPSSGWLFFIALLLAARYLQPTEAAIFGETLWQAQFWLLGAAAWCWFAFRASDRSLSFSLLDVFLGLIVVGHALSTIPVFVEGGDRRAAVNVDWEWAGLAATLFLVRQLLPHVGTKRLLSVFTSVMVGMAALGVWQHHVSFQETAARYDELITRESQLAALATQGDATASQRRELADVRRELSDFGIPSDAAARRQWENRIKFSSEPFGTFGLANTFGGLLAAAIPILLSRLGGVRGWKLAAFATAVVVVLYCLLLTKSRTAWVGLSVGGAAALALHFARGRLERRTLIAVAVILLFVAASGVAVLASGGLDREVLSEAPKSLQYRLDYWTGTLAVLQEHPILGTGPANFRSHYLEHRPIGASEEIAAPHNLFFDIWTAGGLISLMSLLALLLKAASDIVHVRDATPIGDAPPGGANGFTAGAATAFFVTFVVYFLGGDGLDWRLIGMAPLAVVLLMCQESSNSSSAEGVGIVAGLVALIVHLLGADGIEFPAVLQTLLLFSLALDRPRWTVGSNAALATTAGAFALLAAGCFLSGVVPVLNGGALTARATVAIAAGDPTADRLIDEAIAADTLANTPLMLRAELDSARALSRDRTADILDARRGWRALLDRDPRSLIARRRLAELLLATGSERDADEAAELLARAVDLSPTDSQMRVDSARAFAAADRPRQAAEQAAAALRLDDVNRAAGHTDILLDDASRGEMEAAVGNAGAVP